MSQPSEAFEIVRLKNGQPSIRSLTHGETMHIGSDPREEALTLHIRQPRLMERALSAKDAPFIIWDIGLGPAGNALATLSELRACAAALPPIEIHSFEISTAVLAFALEHTADLPTLQGWEAPLHELLNHGHCAPLPDQPVTWHLHRGDFSSGIPSDIPSPHAIFFDPYSPAKNPEMWSLETLRTLRERVTTPAILTNYTRSTAIRVTLALAGWWVGRGVPTGDKTETTVAATSADLLAAPLDASWLSRVRASTNAAPFRNALYQPGPISPDDLAALEAHPQFSES